MEMIILLIIIAVVAAIVISKKRDKKEQHPKTTADFKMGTDYTFGRGIPALDKLAAEIFSATARNGDIDACAALGYMYSRGIHFKQDYEEASKWYT